MVDLDTYQLQKFVLLADRLATTLRDLAERVTDQEAFALVREYEEFKAGVDPDSLKREGAAARLRKVGYKDCPYPVGTPAGNWWREGWLADHDDEIHALGNMDQLPGMGAAHADATVTLPLDARSLEEVVCGLSVLISAGNDLDGVACNARCYDLNVVDLAEAEEASRKWREARDVVMSTAWWRVR